MMIMVMTDSYDDYGDDNKVIIKQIAFPVSKHYYKNVSVNSIKERRN
mgnify:CR=1 FL=1